MAQIPPGDDPRALPPNEYDVGSQHHTAYARALDLESRQPDAPLFPRVAGQMMLQAPTPEGRDWVASSINSCEDDDVLNLFGRFCIDHLVLPFRAAGGMSRPPSQYPSRPSFEVDRETISWWLKEAGHDYSTSRHLAMRREHYRCRITRRIDSSTFFESEELRTEALNMGTPRTFIEYAHIFPQSIDQKIDKPEYENKSFNTSGVWGVLQKFGLLDPTELSGNKLHRVENGMMLSTSIHREFGNQFLWLEEDESENTPPNTYFCRSPDVGGGFLPEGVPPVVTFTSHEPDIPLPNPLYLKLHAACARVANLSGAAEYVQKILDDLRDTKVLSEDGSSVGLLFQALSMRDTTFTRR